MTDALLRGKDRGLVAPTAGVDARGFGFHAGGFVLLFPFGAGCVEALQQWFCDGRRVGNVLGVPFFDRLDWSGPGRTVAHLQELARAFVKVWMTAVQSQ